MKPRILEVGLVGESSAMIATRMLLMLDTSVWQYLMTQNSRAFSIVGLFYPYVDTIAISISWKEMSTCAKARREPVLKWDVNLC